jgi:hypothetical protein
MQQAVHQARGTVAVLDTLQLSSSAIGTVVARVTANTCDKLFTSENSIPYQTGRAHTFQKASLLVRQRSPLEDPLIQTHLHWHPINCHGCT